MFRLFKKEINHQFVYESSDRDSSKFGDNIKKYLEYAKVGDLFIIEVAEDK